MFQFLHKLYSRDGSKIERGVRKKAFTLTLPTSTGKATLYKDGTKKFHHFRQMISYLCFENSGHLGGEAAQFEPKMCNFAKFGKNLPESKQST